MYTFNDGWNSWNCPGRRSGWGWLKWCEEEVEEYKPTAEVFVIVEEMPTFPGGTEALFKFIYDNIEYPRDALEKEWRNVVVSFCVTYKGKIEQSEVSGVSTHPSMQKLSG